MEFDVSGNSGTHYHSDILKEKRVFLVENMETFAFSYETKHT